MNIWATIFVVIFAAGGIGWLWWACMQADFVKEDEAAHKAWLAENAKRTATIRMIRAISGGPKWDDPGASRGAREGWLVEFHPMREIICCGHQQVDFEVLGWFEGTEEEVANTAVTVRIHRTKDGKRTMLIWDGTWSRRWLVEKPKPVWREA